MITIVIAPDLGRAVQENRKTAIHARCHDDINDKAEERLVTP
jgi:hypothetical protein